MANIASARRRARQAVKRRAHNASFRSYWRTKLKNVVLAIEKRDKTAATAAYRNCVSALDKMVLKGYIHKNKAARHKSRLNAQIKALS